MSIITYNTEIRKRGYEWVVGVEAAERDLVWNRDHQNNNKTWRQNYLRTAKKDNNPYLVPVDPTPNAHMTVKSMEKDTWVSFYRVAEKTKVGTDNPLPDDEIKTELLKFFNQHGIANGETAEFKYMRESLVIINDLFLARDEGNMEEVYRILKGGGLDNTQFNFKDIEHFYFDIQAKLSFNEEGELGLAIECVCFFDFILYDFLFSKGVLQRWFICKHCEGDFQYDRKKDYCSSACKRRAAYERQLSKKGKVLSEEQKTKLSKAATRRSK